MPGPVHSISRTNLGNAGLLALGLVPITFIIFTVIRFWQPLPMGDEWVTPANNLISWHDGNTTWRELFAQHNESRKFFPRVLYITLAQIGGWDVRKEMSITLLMMCASVFIIYRLLRRTEGATTRSALIAWIPAAFLCFSPAQIDNFLWGVQLEVFFPGLAVLLMAAVNLSSLPLPRKALINGALAFVATYTVAHGMLLWFLGIPLQSKTQSIAARQRILFYGIYLVCAAISTGAYFIDYHRPSYHPEFLAGHPGVVTLFHYVVLWVGSFFNSTSANPFMVGVAAITAFAAALLGSVWIIWHERDWRAFYPGLLVGAFSCATVAITAVGRIGFGIEQALDDRYRTYSLSFYLAIVLLLFAIYCRRIRKSSAPTRRRIFLGVCALLSLAGLVGWIECRLHGVPAQRAITDRNRGLLRALEWIDVIPDNPDLIYLFQLPKTLPNLVQQLRRRHILRVPFVSEKMARAAHATPHPEKGASPGQLDTCVIDPDHHLLVTGRATLPGLKQPPDCILIGAIDAEGTYKPISIIETRRPRGGETREAENTRFFFGRAIDPANLPAGEVTIAAWAVDLQSQKLYPLAGATPIPAQLR